MTTPTTAHYLNAQNKVIAQGLNASGFAFQALVAHGITVEQVIIEAGRPVFQIQSPKACTDLISSVYSTRRTAYNTIYTANFHGSNIRWSAPVTHLTAVSTVH